MTDVTVKMVPGDGTPVTKVTGVTLAFPGGGLIDGSTYTLEYNAGTLLAPDGTSVKIPFDTLSEGVTDLGNGLFSVPDGVYIAMYDIEPTQPAQDRWGHVKLTSSLGTLMVSQVAFSSSSGNSDGYQPSDQKLMGGGTISVSFNARSTGGTSADLTLQYALLELKKIG